MGDQAKFFFKEATLHICGSLDIEKAMQRCLMFIKDYIPASLITLHVYDHNTNLAEIIAYATPQESKLISIKFPYTSTVKEEMGKRQKKGMEIWQVRKGMIVFMEAEVLNLYQADLETI